MSVFAISDLHLSLSCDKPMDVFPGWYDYTERLIKEWTSVVSENDTVVVPGDISWGMSLDESQKDFMFINSLPGRKVIMKGNHDYWWTTVSKMNRFLDENGIDSISFVNNDSYFSAEDKVSICGSRGWVQESSNEGDVKIIRREAMRLRSSLRSASAEYERLCFLHYPPVLGNYCCREIIDVLKEEGIKTCYFGHLHGIKDPAGAQFLHEGISFKLISSDYLKFRPVKVL